MQRSCTERKSNGNELIQKAEERIFTEKNRVGREVLSIALE